MHPAWVSLLSLLLRKFEIPSILERLLLAGAVVFVPVAISVGVAMVPGDAKLAFYWFHAAAISTAVAVFLWEEVATLGKWRFPVTGIALLIVIASVQGGDAWVIRKVQEAYQNSTAQDFRESKGIAERFWESRRIKDTNSANSEKNHLSPSLLSPSFAFVFGSPLGDNHSSEWVMIGKHYGHGPAFNNDLVFYDSDRQNIQHKWLVDHPSLSFAPPNLTGGDASHYVHWNEIDLAGPPHVFKWVPIDSDRQHYAVEINSRDGQFHENWEVTRIDGILRTSITIDRIIQRPNGNPLFRRVFTCKDPEFSSTPLASAMPSSWPPPPINPGWQPNHQYEIPVMILAPNETLQFVSGFVGKSTHLGCWDILKPHPIVQP